MILRSIATATAGLLLAATPAHAGHHEPDQHEHTVTTVPAEGTFTCGDLTLTIESGSETETFDGVLQNGVVRIRITRDWDDVTLEGSDGRSYRASGHTRARFVLVDPDFDNPVWGREDILVKFRTVSHRLVGYLREVIRIRHGVETDVVSGPCDFGE
jgi:hypothetical protein